MYFNHRLMRQNSIKNRIASSINSFPKKKKKRQTIEYQTHKESQKLISQLFHLKKIISLLDLNDVIRSQLY